MIKSILPFFVASLLFLSSASAQSLSVHDISSVQLRLIKQQSGVDSLERSKVFMDSLYYPYKSIWDGYMGSGDNLVQWTNESILNLPELIARSKTVNISLIKNDLLHIASEMEQLTGYKAFGNWYIFYGPAWTDLGSLGDLAMVIDLTHKSNSSNECIRKILPHELTHQIMSYTNTQKDTTAISGIIGAGFAVWVNQKYWKETYSLADHLGYTEEELLVCDKNLEALKGVYVKYRYSSNPDVIDLFRNRNSKLNDKLPGAIGYYIGYRIVDAYVRNFGENSFKDLFTKSPKQVAEESGF